MIGQTISHYKILEKLGEGGMGVVYKAEDTKLKRTVALKFLPPGLNRDSKAKERFVIEAQAAAALNHPNIVTVHEIDEYDQQFYIAMEYIQGETLKEKIDAGPLEIDDAVSIALQAAEGLREAHKKNILHRDIKSANIMVTVKGQTKIMDFGLAKLKGHTIITKEGTTLGTAAYMSPEQAQGAEVDHRTDIWSLGVVLYEMLTGGLPFKGEYEPAVIYAILSEKPEPLSSVLPETPKEVENLVDKMLEKNTDKRFQHVDEIIETLKELSNKFKYQLKEKKMIEITSTNKKKKFLLVGVSALVIIAFIVIYIFILSKPVPLESKSIAVLPFKNMSENQQNEYFCDGVTEDIITQLSKIDDLKVTSRTSVFYFKNKDIKIKNIARELKVATILEGSVRQSMDRVRITAQLINARTDAHLWAETYDRELKDIFEIQSDVATQIAKTLKVTLFPGLRRRLSKKPTENIKAYQIYLQGKFHWNRRMPEDLEKAILFFERAVSLDPQYALGYSGLAETYVVIGDHARIVGTLNLVKPQIAYPKAEQYCLKALSIDNELAEAYAALGEVRCDWKWDFPGAEKALKKAIELNPNYATAHQWLAEYYFGLGNIHSAREAIDRARELDPFSFIIQFVNARVHLGERNYYNSIEILNEILTKIPDFQPAHLVIAHAYLLSKSYDLALLHIAKFKNPLSVKYFKCRILAKSGDINQAKKMLQDSLSIPDIYDWPGALAIIYGELGQIDEAVKWYKKAIEKHSQFVLFRHGFGRCDVLNNDPRVKEMLREAGLDR